MSRTTRRVLRAELLRGAAPVAAIGVLLAGLFLMYDSMPYWAGRWMPFAVQVRGSLFLLAGLVVMIAAWQAGRERRRGIREQLVATPRAGWQPFVLAWAAVTLGALVALLVIVLVGAAFVAPVASYAGGGWWWVLAVTFLAMTALSALGAAAGRLIPSRLVGPVAGLATYSLMVLMVDGGPALSGIRYLFPALPWYAGAGNSVDGWLTVWQALWFVGLAATVLVVVSGRRKWLAVVPVAVAISGAAPLVLGPVGDRQPDLAALELVCTKDGGPEVCVTRVNVFLLEDVTGPAREVLARWSGVPRGPTRAVDSLVSWDPQWAEGEPLDPNDLSQTGLPLQLDRAATLTGELRRQEDGMIVPWGPVMACEDMPDPDDSLVEVVGAWGSGDQPVWLTGEQRALFDALAGLPEAEQKAWFASYLEAATDCDQEALSELTEELA